MKTLKNCIKLSSSIKIYIPSTIEVTEKFGNDEWIDKTLKFLATKFGGATATKAFGAWITEQDHLITENITLALAYTSQEKLERNIDDVYNFCLSMRKELRQEAISLEVNGEMYFI